MAVGARIPSLLSAGASVGRQPQRQSISPRHGDGLIHESGSENDGEVSTPVKANSHFSFVHLNIGGQVDQVMEDLACLSIGAAAHALGNQAVQPAGQNQESRNEINLQTDGRRKGVHVKKAHGIPECIFNQQLLGVPRDHRVSCGVPLVGKQNGCFLVAKVLDDTLSELIPRQADRLLIGSGSRDVMPSRTGSWPE